MRRRVKCCTLLRIPFLNGQSKTSNFFFPLRNLKKTVELWGLEWNTQGLIRDDQNFSESKETEILPA